MKSPSYPIDEILPELINAVQNNSNVILQAPAGAGKTTRVPLALLETITPDHGRIVMLEPRRIAAVSAAYWMAYQLGQKVGETIGYTIRFDRKVTARTRIEVVTEGVLTRRIQSDQALDEVAMVIFDEFHERHIHSDLALAFCIDVQQTLRNDLKIIIMSATLQSQSLASLLSDVHLVNCPSKTFPVEDKYIPPPAGVHLLKHIVHTTMQAVLQTHGDILVFLPGMKEIRFVAEDLNAFCQKQKIELCALHGELSLAEQERALRPLKHRKIVLATNIAETSLTIERVRVVIDSGQMRRVQYDPSSEMSRLITVPISRASADQRKGRAGRLGSGICYRLYSQHTYSTLRPFAVPEIMTADLTSLVLEMALWGVRNPTEMHWLDQPQTAAWEAALRLLIRLGALDDDGFVTPLGKRMARLPLHPRLAKLILRSQELQAVDIGIDVAAMLSERDIFRYAIDHRDDYEPDITERIRILKNWRQNNDITGDVDICALRSIERTAKELRRLIYAEHDSAAGNTDLLMRLLLSAYPDRLAKRRPDETGRFLLAQGGGVRVPFFSSLSLCDYIVALILDAGGKGDGIVHVACPLTEEIIRAECREQIKYVRTVTWDKRRQRIIATIEECIGDLTLSSRPFQPSDEESIPLLCDAIASDPSLLPYGKVAKQFAGRVALMRKYYPDEGWPDYSQRALAAEASYWLASFLSGVGDAAQLRDVDIVSALQAGLSWQQQRLLPKRAPRHIIVPSGSRIFIDYARGDFPVLAVKLQEMFGCADTPTIADGQVNVLLYLLSPAQRPVQITHDLNAFWNSGYFEVRRALRGRYPKHLWPDDPWNAIATRRTKRSKS